MIRITLPDGAVREVAEGTSFLEIAQGISPKLAKTAVCVRWNGELRDLREAVPGDGTLVVVGPGTPEAVETLRHTASHVMAQAVKRKFPSVRLGIGPAIAEGFYYDLDLSSPLGEEDLAHIETEMRDIIAAGLPITRRELSKADARALFEERGESYKLELIDEIEDKMVSVFEQGEFVDLCRGPHLRSTGGLRADALKLLSVAGAYWRGDEERPMLQRIYGTAWEKAKDLEQYLWRLEEAAKRDHRRLGKDLDLFSIHEEGGAGLICWHPKGARLRRTIEEFWYAEHDRHGYDIVTTPHIGKEELWTISGHLGFYRENMYSPMDIDGADYFIKPMNCPYQILIYKTRTHSYRELPMRMAELGTVYRYERSGVLHGLLRVRGFTIDDGHIYCRPDQVGDEIRGVYDFAVSMLTAFGFHDFDIYLATRPHGDKAVGEPERWEQATDALRAALDARGLPYKLDEGGGAFYGPKIDIKVKDMLGRAWQCSTIQFDFNLPERFDMTYIGEDGAEHRPYMVHRALLGSLERFIGCLIEQYGGAFPVWLSPVQAVVIPIADRHNTYAAAVAERLSKAGLRTRMDDSAERMNAKIRTAQLNKVPYMLVVGDREAEAESASVRLRTGDDKGMMTVDQFLSTAKEIVARKSLEVWPAA